MTPEEIAVRLRDGGATLAFDTNALFGETTLFGVCNSVAQYNVRLAARTLPPVALMVSAIAHAEKVFDLKQQFRDRFDAGVILRGLARKGLMVKAFDAAHALSTAERIGERHGDTASWRGAKRLRCFQNELWKHDILVRGAVTIGNIESKSDFLAGQGLRDADRLLGLAAVPRVIVDPDALAAVEEEPYLRIEGLTTRQELHSIKRLLKCDGDGLWFIDYLAQNEELNVLHEHRFLVERGLQSAKTLDHESRMWTWLFTYHNRVVEDLHARGQIDDAKRRELRIPAKSPLVFEFPPGS